MHLLYYMHLFDASGGIAGTPDNMLPPKKRSTSDAMYDPDTKELIVYTATKCKYGCSCGCGSSMGVVWLL
jgi:hypothetical protein